MENLDLVSLINISVSTIAILAALIFIRQRKTLIKETSKGEALLKDKTPEQLCEQIDSERSSVRNQIALGRTFLDKAESELSNAEKRTATIKRGLEPPTFSRENSDSLKQKILACREEQFRCIYADKAVNSFSNWEFFGSASDGRKMIKDYRWLLLQAFNAEFESIRKTMRFKTFDTAKRKLAKLYEQLERLGESANAKISRAYYYLKLDELTIWFEELKRQEALKEERKRQQALIRQQGRDESYDEIDEALSARESELRKAQEKAASIAGQARAQLELQIEKIKREKAELEAKLQRSISQAQLTRAGYVYVISNIGCFGDEVVKIGMTRRLEPMDRVNELGDASVPFKFDVHALIFSNDAPSLEHRLHVKFQDKRVNTQNPRKEFFRVTAETVKEEITSLDVEADWFITPEARDYHESQLIRQSRKMQTERQKQAETTLPESI